MKLLVTGATGFLGRHLVPYLEGRAHKVVTVGRALDRVEHALSGVDCIIHLAAQTEFGKAVADPETTLEANVRGTWRVLDAARRAGVKRVIVASSDKSYGRATPPYSEDTPLAPDRPYETSKACAEMIARTYGATYGMEIAITRCVNLYGPGHLNFSTLIPGTIKRLLRGESPVVRNGGRMVRDFLFVEDAIDAYAKLAESRETGVFCFGTAKGHRVLDVVTALMEIMESRVSVVDEQDAHGEIVNQWSLYERAKTRLGWHPQWSLKDGLTETVKWYLEYFKR